MEGLLEDWQDTSKERLVTNITGMREALDKSMKQGLLAQD
jgi:hypothetical protein